MNQQTIYVLSILRIFWPLIYKKKLIKIFPLSKIEELPTYLTENPEIEVLYFDNNYYMWSRKVETCFTENPNLKVILTSTNIYVNNEELNFTLTTSQYYKLRWIRRFKYFITGFLLWFLKEETIFWLLYNEKEIKENNILLILNDNFYQNILKKDE